MSYCDYDCYFSFFITKIPRQNFFPEFFQGYESRKSKSQKGRNNFRQLLLFLLLRSWMWGWSFCNFSYFILTIWQLERQWLSSFFFYIRQQKNEYYPKLQRSTSEPQLYWDNKTEHAVQPPKWREGWQNWQQIIKIKRQTEWHSDRLTDWQTDRRTD